jgi:hypothetical protein
MATRATTAPTTGFGRIGMAGVLAGLVGLAITLAVGATLLLNPARSGVGTQLDPAVQRSLQAQLQRHREIEYGLASGPSASDFAAWLQRHREIEYGTP